MPQRRVLSNLVSIASFLSYAFFAPVLASVTVGGMTFDSAVVNDNTSQATPANYSCTQSGGTITLSGQQPTGSSNVTYFYNNLSQGNEWKFKVGIDFTGLTDTNSIAGIMYYSGQFIAATSGQYWCRIGITGNRRIYLENHSYCEPPQKTLLCTLAVSVTTAYILAKIEGGSLEFYLSYQPGITANLIRLGLPTYYPYMHCFGFFLEPHVSAGFETVVFNSITITPRDSTNGVSSLYSYFTPSIVGLTDWAAMTLPANFFNAPMKLVQDIRAAYVTGGNSFTDPHQDTLFANIQSMKTGFSLKTIADTSTELQSLDTSIYNARIYLADILDSLVTGNARRYPSGSTEYNFSFKFSLNTLLQNGIDLVKSCHAASDLNWTNFVNPFEPFTRTYNIADCAVDVADILSAIPEIKQAVKDKDKIIMGAAQYIELLSLIAFLDRNFYNDYYSCLSDYIGKVRSFTQKIAPLFYYNNIPMKVFSAIALWDIAHGATTSSATLNLWLKEKFMDGGAYVEGSQYLDWLNVELLPYYFISAYNGWLPEKLQLKSVKNSGYWLLNMADKSGFIAPVDDGINKAKSWLAPYSFFHNDNAFKEYDSLSYGNIFDPLKFLTYPPQNYPGHLMQNKVGVYEGVGKMNLTSTIDSADLSITLVTEAAGKIKENGGSHDQQDDGSISIRRTGTLGSEDLIFDPGYAGYSKKERDEFFEKHNTVQINTLTHGGINSCPFGTAESLMTFAGDCLGIDLNDLADNLIGGVYLLTQPSLSATLITSTTYSNLKDMPVERIAAGGPGYSEIVKVYSNGFRAKITYDTKSDYALRSVLHFDDDIFVIDQISSNSGDYSIHYNLPQNTTGTGTVFIGENNLSQIRLSGFCSDTMNPTVCKPDSFNHRDRENGPPMYVSSVRYSNAGTNLPPLGSFCSFLSILEPSPASYTYGAPYTPVTGNTGDAQICISRPIDADNIRYVFVNTVTNGVRGTVRIPAIAGWHSELVTDAEYGIVEFDRNNPGTTNRINLYQGTVATYAGQNIDLATVSTGNLVLDKTASTGGAISNESITHSGDSITIQADYDLPFSREGYLFAHPFPLIEGDFTATVRVTDMDTTFQEDLKGLFYRIDNLIYWYNVYNDWDPTNLRWNLGMTYPPHSFVPGQCWLKLERKGHILNSYYSNDGVTYYRAISSPDITLQTNGNSGHVGLCLRFINHAALNDRTIFSDFTITRPTLHPSFRQNFAQNTTLPALDFVSDTGGNGWVANSTEGFMFTSTAGGASAPARITTPTVTANRNLDSGVTVEFRVQFPAWYYNGNFSQYNTLDIEILAGGAAAGYSLVFKPTPVAAYAPTYDFQLNKIGGGSLVQLNSGTITPLGSDSASWVKFRIDLLPNPSAGGAGEIDIYYDADDGIGFVKEIEAFDTTFGVFSNLAFTYTTGEGVDNYTARIADISIAKRKSTSGMVNYRYPLIPSVDTVFYQGGGTWVARYGYNNPNAVTVEIPVSNGNGFSYQGGADLDKGQPTTFSPGEFHSVFGVNFDGSALIWTLDSTTLTVNPLYPMKLEMKDNGITENNISKPQIKVTNLGTQILSGFKLRLWFSRAEYPSQYLITDKYYVNPAGITVAKGVHPSNANIVFVDVIYPASYQLLPGATTPVDGVQLGVHFNNYYPGQWQKSNDWSWQGITGTFSETQYVTVYDGSGNLIFGLEPDPVLIPSPPNITKAEVFSFEKLGGWIAPPGSASLNTVKKTNGTYSLQISGGGYQTINSIDLATTSITGVTSTLKVDFNIGLTQPNPYWIGQVQLYVSCPSANISDYWIGQRELTGLPKNVFNALSFTMPGNIKTILAQNHPDFSFKWVLNTNAGSGPFLFDNMRFVAP